MRVGAFQAVDFQFGIPASIAKPADNNYPIFDSELLSMSLSNQDLQDLQARIQAVYETLRGARDYMPTP